MQETTSICDRVQQHIHEEWVKELTHAADLEGDEFYHGPHWHNLAILAEAELIVQLAKQLAQLGYYKTWGIIYVSTHVVENARNRVATKYLTTAV
jgi:hypothetical protein